MSKDQKDGRELKEAHQVLNDYAKKDGTIDIGNVFFAAHEFKRAYLAERDLRVKAEAELALVEEENCEMRVALGLDTNTAEVLSIANENLRKERDELRQKLEAAEAEARKWKAFWILKNDKNAELEKERDALKAENKRLRDALTQIANTYCG